MSVIVFDAADRAVAIEHDQSFDTPSKSHIVMHTGSDTFAHQYRNIYRTFLDFNPCGIYVSQPLGLGGNEAA